MSNTSLKLTPGGGEGSSLVSLGTIGRSTAAIMSAPGTVEEVVATSGPGFAGGIVEVATTAAVGGLLGIVIVDVGVVPP